MNSVPAPFIQIPVYEEELAMLIDDGTNPFDQQATAPVRENLTGQGHMGEVHITNRVNCPACGEQVETFSELPYARCRLPEGCGHMFCRICLVDYLPVMREGNHQHRSGCRHYERFNRVDTLPAYLVPFGQEQLEHPTQVAYHRVAQDPRPFSTEKMSTQGSTFQVWKWLKRALWAIFVSFILLVAMAFFIVLTGRCECRRPGPGALIALPAASTRISN